MAVKKIYTSIDKEMQITWSEEGIHLTIEIAGVLYPIEFIIDPYDVDDIVEDVKMYRDIVFDANRGLEKRFNEFKESIINTLIEMDNEFYREDGMYLYQKEIAELKAVNNFTDMARILVDCEYWDFSDAMMYSRKVIE